MSNIKIFELFKESADAISNKPAARKRMKERYKLRLCRLAVLENLFQIDLWTSRTKLFYKDYSINASEFMLYRIIKEWFYSQKPEYRKQLIPWADNLGKVVKVCGITPKQFLLRHMVFCIQNIKDLQKLRKTLKCELNGFCKTKDNDSIPINFSIKKEVYKGDPNISLTKTA